MPANGGAAICATDVSDCCNPSTLPCSDLGAAWVIKLVSVGRTNPPNAVTVAASANIGIECDSPKQRIPG